MNKNNKEKDCEKPEGLSLNAGLYCVATPIGNLGDITMRALDVLRAADVILCEDTRVTRKLFRAYQFENSSRLQVYNDHSKEGVRLHIIDMIKQGKSVALVSDAGMPLISDPGYKLVRHCQEEGVYITTLPGANAPLSAMQLSGMSSDKFCFLGFLPSKSSARRKLLAEWKTVNASLIAFESARRLIASLEDIHAALGNREVAVVREITKMYEEVKRGYVEDLIQIYQEAGPPKGEIVLVIASDEDADKGPDDECVHAMLHDALETMKVKDATKYVADQTGRKKTDLYEMALSINKEQKQED